MNGTHVRAVGDVATLPEAGAAAPDRTTAPGATPVWIALVTLAAALFASQYVTLAKLKVLLLTRAPTDPVIALSARASTIVLESWRALLNPADLAIVGTILAASGYLVVSEMRRGAFTAVLHQAERSPRVLFAFLTLAAVVVTRTYVTPGEVFMGDTDTHLLRSWMFAEHFRQLDTPVWSNTWYGGFPLLTHYGPLYFAVTAVLTLLTGDVHLATKLLLWACHVASIFAMFAYLREVTRRDLAALVGALAYALSFHRIHIVLYRGDLQVAALFAIVPVLLLLVERFLRTRAGARSTFVLLTLGMAAMVLNHHGYGFFGLVLLGLYVFVRLAAASGPLVDRLRLLTFFALAEVAAVCISAFLIVPFMFGMDEHRGMPNSVWPILTPNPLGPILLTKLFRWTLVGDNTSIGYVGLSIGLLALGGLAYGIRRRSPAAAALTVCAVASLLMVENNVSYNVKNVNFFMIFVSALSAWALLALEGRGPAATLQRARERWGDRFGARIAAVAIGLLLLDLGPTTFQSLFREDVDFKQPLYDKAEALGGPYKLIERQVRDFDPSVSAAAHFDPNRLGIPTSFAGTQTPLGLFHEGAGRSFGYSAEMVKALHRDLNHGRVSKWSADGLYVMGVKYVVFRDRYRWFTPPLEPSPYFTMEDDILRLTHASPLLLSTRAIGLSDVAGYPASDAIRDGRYLEPETYDYSGEYYDTLVQPILRTMNIDPARGVADVLIARDGDLAVDMGSNGTLEASIRSFSSELKRVEVRYEASTNAVGHLPYTYFPYLDVRIDGERVPFHRSALNTILLRVPGGEHVITIRGVAPPLQRSMAWISALSLLGVLVLPRFLFTPIEPAKGSALDVPAEPSAGSPISGRR